MRGAGAPRIKTIPAPSFSRRVTRQDAHAQDGAAQVSQIAASIVEVGVVKRFRKEYESKIPLGERFTATWDDPEMLAKGHGRFARYRAGAL